MFATPDRSVGAALEGELEVSAESAPLAGDYYPALPPLYPADLPSRLRLATTRVAGSAAGDRTATASADAGTAGVVPGVALGVPPSVEAGRGALEVTFSSVARAESIDRGATKALQADKPNGLAVAPGRKFALALHSWRAVEATRGWFRRYAPFNSTCSFK